MQARAQKRFVLLDLEAIWCHWCHVMDQTTYQDRDVTRLIAEQYIAVRVDQDADPALAARYQDYGWPATIVLAAGWFGNRQAPRLSAAGGDGLDARRHHQRPVSRALGRCAAAGAACALGDSR